MHELALMESVVDIISERLFAEHGEVRVSRIELEIGRLSAVMPDAMRFCFDICSADTPLAGAALVIREIRGVARCHTCSQTIELDDPIALCPCGSADVDILSGQELTIKSVEISSAVEIANPTAIHASGVM